MAQAEPRLADWRLRHPTDADAPRVGSWRGWGRFFLARRRRVVGRDKSEALHPTAEDRKDRLGLPVSERLALN